MNYISKLSIKSFRKFELNLLLDFFFKVKRILISNVYTEFLLTKFTLLLKLSLNLFTIPCIRKVGNIKVYHYILCSNYYYFNNSNYCISDSNILYNHNTFKNFFREQNNFLYESVSLKFINKILLNCKLNSFSSMPTKLKLFTVLRSPHTDKKSREQFILKKYKKVLNDKFNFLYFLNSFTFLFGMKTCQLKYKKYTYL